MNKKKIIEYSLRQRSCEFHHIIEKSVNKFVHIRDKLEKIEEKTGII